MIPARHGVSRRKNRKKQAVLPVDGDEDTSSARVEEARCSAASQRDEHYPCKHVIFGCEDRVAFPPFLHILAKYSDR
jgi:hypothetical protein